MLSARNAVSAVPAYHPPLAGREGLRLDFNENTVGCSPRVLERLRSLTAEDLPVIPSANRSNRAVAEFLGVSTHELLLTNGVDEAIHLLCETYLDPGRRSPHRRADVFDVRDLHGAAGAQVIAIPAGPEFRFPLDAVRASITARTRLIAIANPNNPTGTLHSPEQLLEIARSAPDCRAP